MARARRYDSLQVGQFGLIAGIASVVFIALWFALGHGRNGALSDCLIGGGVVHAIIGALAWAAVTATAALAAVSLFTPSRWWGLSGVGLVLISMPVILVVTFIAMAGDPGGPGICRS